MHMSNIARNYNILVELTELCNEVNLLLSCSCTPVDNLVNHQTNIILLQMINGSKAGFYFWWILSEDIKSLN